jgi:hypothetical protein
MMQPVVTYLIASMAFAALFFVLAARFRTAGVQPPEHPGLVSVIGGVAWPLVLVGLLELGAIALVRKRLGAAQSPVTGDGLPLAPVSAPARTLAHV